MLIYQAIVTAIVAALLLNTIVNLFLLRRPARRPPPATGPLVSILVPARNEARSIVACVESLARQDYPRCEVLVLDDHSEDQTAALVADLARRYSNVRLLRGEPLPPNWHGKAFACAQLARAARGEWLLFVDADTTHAPDCVSTALRAAQEQRADLLTMMPRLLAETFGEALLMPTIPLAFVGAMPLALVTSTPWSPFATAIGHFLLFRREIYQRIGGHEAARTEIVEDILLSRLVKRHGGRVVWIDGTELTSVRMYHNLGEAWRGMAKSSFAAVGYSLPALLVGVLPCVAIFLAPYGFLAAALITRQSSVALLWLPLAQIALIWASYLLLASRFYLRRRLVVLHAGIILAIILFTLYSAYQSIFGAGVAWKGRTYQFGARRRPGLRIRVAAPLPLVRLLLAGTLIVLGWRWRGALLRLAALVPLTGWSANLLERALRRESHSRWGAVADAAEGIASLAYLQLSGLLSLQLVLPALLVIGISARFLPWRVVLTFASTLLGGVLVLTAATTEPALDLLLIGWTAGLALLASRPITRALLPWLQRFRSP
jgi:chlorobactene glucosyltransferase